MVKLNDPSTFWGNSNIGISASKKMSVGIPFLMPQLMSKGELVFDTIAKRICLINESEFMKGYVDLDKIWNESNDSIIKQYREYRQQITDDGDGTIIEEKPPLIERYPEPYCGRRAYLCQIPFYNRKNEDGDVIFDANTKKPIKILGGLKAPLKDSKGKSYNMKVGICAFHNVEELKWNEEWLKKETQKTVADDGTIIDLPDETSDEQKGEEYRYVPSSCWVTKAYAKELNDFSKEIIENNPKIESCFGFVLTQLLKPSKDPKYGPSLNLSRLLIM